MAVTATTATTTAAGFIHFAEVVGWQAGSAAITFWIYERGWVEAGRAFTDKHLGLNGLSLMAGKYYGLGTCLQKAGTLVGLSRDIGDENVLTTALPALAFVVVVVVVMALLWLAASAVVTEAAVAHIQM